MRSSVYHLAMAVLFGVGLGVAAYARDAATTLILGCCVFYFLASFAWEVATGPRKKPARRVLSSTWFEA